MKLAIGTLSMLFILAQFGQAQTDDSPNRGRMELLACLEANSSVFNEMLREEQSNHWKDEFAVGIHADCTASQIVHGTVRAASVDGKGFVVVVHTHPEWPNSGPSTGDYLLTREDRVSRAVLQRCRKIVVPFANGSSKRVKLHGDDSPSPDSTELLGQVAKPATESFAVMGATPEQEALVRSYIQIMQPSAFPLRVVFVPHWKYVDNTRIFQLHVPTGYTSSLFAHLPSRTVFIDTDRYFDQSLGYWLAHELGHIATNSAKEEDAEKAAHEFRKRLKDPQRQDLH